MDEELSVRSNDILLKKIKYLENIISLMPDHVYWKDRNGILQGCNEKQAIDLGLKSRHDIVGKSEHELVWQYQSDEAKRKHVQSVEQADKEVMTLGVAKTFEESAILSNGEKAIFVSQKVPLRDEEGEVVGLLGISFDITERKEMEVELAAAKQREEEIRKATMIFAGSMVHDLRTPLATIRIMASSLKKYLSVLLQEITDSQQVMDLKKLDYLKELPDQLITVTQSLDNFVTQSLKALNKAATDIQSQDDLVPCVLWHCLSRTLGDYPFVGNEQQLLHWNRSDSFEFLGNPILFYRIMANLIQNALQQIHQHNQGEIFIRAEKTDDFNILYFKDTAGHLTPESIQHVFDGYKTTKAAGTGVGLSFCKLTMQSFGGDLACHLVDNKFIEFILKFPTIK